MLYKLFKVNNKLLQSDLKQIVLLDKQFYIFSKLHLILYNLINNVSKPLTIIFNAHKSVYLLKIKPKKMKKGPKKADSEIDFGSVIKQYMDQKKISGAALARKLNVTNSTVSNFKKNKDLKGSTLAKLTTALKHNFFADISLLFAEEYTQNKPVDPRDAQIATLQHENLLLKTERDVLLKAFGKGV